MLNDLRKLKKDFQRLDFISIDPMQVELCIKKFGTRLPHIPNLSG